MTDIEAIVIGAGVVGLAIARALALAGHEVLILEAESAIGSVTSARNSGVIHAGLHYRRGSLKARCCVEGRAALYSYAAERGIAHSRCGKLIVATNEAQIATLHEIKKSAAANNVQDLVLLSSSEARTREPAINAVAALSSPSTGIIDVHELMLSYLGDAENAGATLALKSSVETVSFHADGFVVGTQGNANGRISCRHLINAAGLSAQDVAGRIAGLNKATIPKQILAKGSYFTLTGPQPFHTLIYPIPEPGGLGIHATLDLAGRVRFGPDVEWVDTIDYEVGAGRSELFYAAIRQYWPDLPEGALQPDFAGIRPKLAGSNAPDEDFMIQGPRDHGVRGLVNLYGIESPGLTSSLVLAERALQALHSAP